MSEKKLLDGSGRSLNLSSDREDPQEFVENVKKAAKAGGRKTIHHIESFKDDPNKAQVHRLHSQFHKIDKIK